MRIRPYQNKDFSTISKWISDERSHALWCANLIPYPLEKKGFDDILLQAEERFNDSPFVATTDDGKIIGFFCFSVNLNTNEGMLKFVVVDDTLRNKGYGCEMIKLAVKYAFEIEKAEAVHLNVFPTNPGAMKCYQKAGFKERSLKENAFTYKDESWGSYNMIVTK